VAGDPMLFNVLAAEKPTVNDDRDPNPFESWSVKVVPERAAADKPAKVPPLVVKSVIFNWNVLTWLVSVSPVTVTTG